MRSRNYPTRNFSLCLVLLGLLLSTVIPANAGSTKPNPAALAKAAAAKRADYRIIDTETNAFLTRLATDRAYAKRFDAAAFQKNREELGKLFKEGGFKRSEVQVDEIGEDLRITITITWDKVRITITISW
jgi:hypothetical protein